MLPQGQSEKKEWFRQTTPRRPFDRVPVAEFGSAPIARVSTASPPGSRCEAVHLRIAWQTVTRMVSQHEQTHGQSADPLRTGGT